MSSIRPRQRVVKSTSVASREGSGITQPYLSSSMTEEFPNEMEGTALPVIKFLESDYKKIPYTDHIRLPKKLNRTAVTVWARYWNRKGLRVDMIGTSRYKDVFKIVNEVGLSKEFLHSRLKAADFAKQLNDAAAQFQEILWSTEPLPPHIIGTVTIPDDQDAVLHNVCCLNRQKQESNTN